MVAQTISHHKILRFRGRGTCYDIAPDGQRIVLSEIVAEEESREAIVVVQNWYEEFRDTGAGLTRVEATRVELIQRLRLGNHIGRNILYTRHLD